MQKARIPFFSSAGFFCFARKSSSQHLGFCGNSDGINNNLKAIIIFVFLVNIELIKLKKSSFFQTPEKQLFAGFHIDDEKPKIAFSEFYFLILYKYGYKNEVAMWIVRMRFYGCRLFG